MAATITSEPEPMAKQRTDEAVRLGADVTRQARVVAAIRGVSLGQYLTELLRPAVEADFRREAENLAAELKPKPPKKGR